MMQVFSHVISDCSNEMVYQKFGELSSKKADDEKTDNNILNMEPVIPCRPRYVKWSVF